VTSGIVRVRTTRVESWDSVPDLGEAWDDLLDRSPNCSVFQTFPWHVCWWKAFGAPHDLLLILAHAGSDLVGIAPMMITRDETPHGRVRKRACFIGSPNHASDYCDFIVDPEVPEALGALVDEVFAASSQCDRLELSHFPGHSPNRVRILEHLGNRRAKTAVEFEADAPVRILGDTEADLKASNKASLKRHTNYFKKAGDLRFHQCGSEAEILSYLDQFFEQHKTRRERTDSPSQFLDPVQRSFYRDLVRDVFPHGWLRFHVVLFNGMPLAFHFGFEYRKRFIWYKPTFDVQYTPRSPGEVLIKFLLEDAIRKGLEEFDFTVGSESFKYRFSNRTRINYRLTVFRSAADYWVYRGKSLLKKLLKRELLSRGGAVSPQE